MPVCLCICACHFLNSYKFENLRLHLGPIHEVTYLSSQLLPVRSFSLHRQTLRDWSDANLHSSYTLAEPRVSGTPLWCGQHVGRCAHHLQAHAGSAEAKGSAPGSAQRSCGLLTLPSAPSRSVHAGTFLKMGPMWKIVRRDEITWCQLPKGYGCQRAGVSQKDFRLYEVRSLHPLKAMTEDGNPFPLRKIFRSFDESPVHFLLAEQNTSTDMWSLTERRSRMAAQPP